MSSIESTVITPEDEANLDLAMGQAMKSLREGGVPIGSVVSSDSPLEFAVHSALLTRLSFSLVQLYHHPTKTVLSVGHNQRVQVRFSPSSPGGRGASLTCS